MITPIKSINVWDLLKRENDLLVSIDDIKAIARNERLHTIDEFVKAIEKHQTRQDSYLEPPYVIADIGCMVCESYNSQFGSVKECGENGFNILKNLKAEIEDYLTDIEQ